MTLLRRLVLAPVATLVAASACLGLADRSAAAAPPDPVPTCLPAACADWHDTNVVLSWYTTPPVTHTNGNCSPGETIDVEGVTTWTCAYTNVPSPLPADWAAATAVVRIDKTAPVVAAATPTREPDAGPWYRHPVQVAFSGSDAVSAIQWCAAPTYSAPDSATASVTGTCTDLAGNRSEPFGFSLRYDATGPVVRSGRPSRKPDRGRWYKRPVAWRFTGSDAVSGLRECPPVRYAGPDGPHVRVVGACVDKAGNVTVRGFPFRYDDTPPRPPDVTPVPRDRAVELRIRTAPDVRRITIVRAPGRGGTEDSTIYRGKPRSFTDMRAVNGKRYRYRVIAADAAANRSRRTAMAVPRPRLIAPADGAALYAPPMLRWTPVRGADYYNVQLRRGGRKVLSRWPGRAELQLHPRWRFEGRIRRLRPSHYRWHVWPGFGARSQAIYGRRIGSRSFVVPAPATARR
jgi:hypothetical protein